MDGDTGVSVQVGGGKEGRGGEGMCAGGMEGVGYCGELGYTLVY